MIFNRKKRTRSLEVKAVTDISKNYRRITFGGDDLDGFPTDETGGYVKLLMPSLNSSKPMMRTYTIRHTRLDPMEIDIDFVLHEHGGPAAQWAANAEPGMSLNIAGPGPKKMVDPNADWYLFAGDMTAMPAICVNLENLPTDARGTAVLEVVSEDDIQPKLAKPEQVKIEWVVNANSGEEPSPLVSAVRNVEWQEGTPGVWSACEFQGMKQLRQYYLKERGLNRKSFYLSSYWKHGVSEDQHKIAKQADAMVN